MIHKALITTVILILFWSIAIKVLPKNLDTVQHQWNYNLIQAQDYLYNTPNLQDKRVIVGTSLSKRMIMELLPDNFINLALGGQSVFDGLDIIEHRAEKPGAIFIETNIVMRDADQQFHKTLFSPVSYYLKKYVVALQEKNQPAGVLRGLTKERVVEDEEIVFNKNAKEEDRVNPRMLKMQKAAYSRDPKRRDLKLALKKLQQNVLELQKEGVTIVFYEMPVHPDLCPMKLPTVIRESLAEVFPPENYLYIKQPDCTPYRTTDGLHLTRLSAMKFSEFFGQQIEALPLSMS